MNLKPATQNNSKPCPDSNTSTTKIACGLKAMRQQKCEHITDAWAAPYTHTNDKSRHTQMTSTLKLRASTKMTTRLLCGGGNCAILGAWLFWPRAANLKSLRVCTHTRSRKKNNTCMVYYTCLCVFCMCTCRMSAGPVLSAFFCVLEVGIVLECVVFRGKFSQTQAVIGLLSCVCVHVFVFACFRWHMACCLPLQLSLKYVGVVLS